MNDSARIAADAASKPNPTGFFEPADVGYAPLETARGPWGQDTLGGQALAALVARELEQHCPIAFGGGRITVDFIRATTFGPIESRVEVARSSSRFALILVDLVQSDRLVLKASGLFVAQPVGNNGDGDAWTPDSEFVHPALPPVATGPQPALMSSAGYPNDWSSDFSAHRNNARKRMWAPAMIAAVHGEEASPFVRASTLAEGTSFITNWAGGTVPYMNVDFTMNLLRIPEPGGLGLESTGQFVANGLSVGSASLYDEKGIVGVSSVTCLALPNRSVKF